MEQRYDARFASMVTSNFLKIDISQRQRPTPMIERL